MLQSHSLQRPQQRAASGAGASAQPQPRLSERASVQPQPRLSERAAAAARSAAAALSAHPQPRLSGRASVQPQPRLSELAAAAAHSAAAALSVEPVRQRQPSVGSTQVPPLLALASPSERPLRRQQRSVRLLLVGARLHSAVAAAAAAVARLHSAVAAAAAAEAVRLEEAAVDLEAEVAAGLVMRAGAGIPACPSANKSRLGGRSRKRRSE